MSVLATWCPWDGVLGAVAPLALATAAGTALVVDLDPDGPDYPGEASLASMVADGPRRIDLEPGRSGVAVLRNGGIDGDDAADLLAAFATGWPHLILRLPPAAERPDRPGLVPVLPMAPGGLFSDDQPAVYQRGPWPPDRPVEGVVLPRPRAGTIRNLLEGRRPGPSRWLRKWASVLEYPWP